MQQYLKYLAIVLIATGLTFHPVADAKPSSRPSSSSSRSSSSFSSKPSSRPSSFGSSSKPSSFGSSSKPSSKPSSFGSSSKPPSSKPSTSFGSSSKPKSSSSFGSSSKPSSPKPSTRPSNTFGSTPSSRPSSESKRTSVSENKSSKPSSRPVTSSSSPTTVGSSSKPKVSFDSKAGASQQRKESEKIYAATKPKETYTSVSGKTVKIEPTAPSVKNIRNNVEPTQVAQHPQRVEHHYHHHYGDRYDYYRSQPYIYVGNGYSPLFWYAMMDWSTHRRAEWLYHHQNEIDSKLYQQQLQNAELRAEIERIKTRGVSPDPNYVDPEFKDNPDLMYEGEYVKAVVNPTPVTTSSNRGGWGCLLVTLGIFVLGGIGVYVVFFHNFEVKK